jgi:hypothetical protein
MSGTWSAIGSDFIQLHCGRQVAIEYSIASLRCQGSRTVACLMILEANENTPTKQPKDLVDRETMLYMQDRCVLINLLSPS